MNMNRPLVVMVDDEPALRTVYQKFLGKRCDVQTFPDGTTFLEALPKLSPSTFVLDWMLPDIDGIELCKHIRQERRLDSVPIAFLTAMRPSIENMQQVFDAGGQIFIEKTGSPATIISQIFAQVEANERARRNVALDVTVMSSLRHDLMGYLTGSITGVEVMAMHPAFEQPDLHNQMENILHANSAIRELIEDMGIVLRPMEVPGASQGEYISLKDLRDYVLGRLDIKNIKVDFPETEVPGKAPRLLGRLLYYIFLLMRYRYSASNSIQVEITSPAPPSWDIRIILSVRAAEDLQETLFGPISSDLSSRPEQALPIQFIARALHALESTMHFAEDETHCTLTFSIPNAGNQT